MNRSIKMLSFSFFFFTALSVVAQETNYTKMKFWSKINECQSQNLVPYRNKSGLLALINKQGKEVTAYSYTYISPFYSNYSKVGLKGFFGIVDTSGKEIIPLKYVKIQNIIDNLFLAEKEDGSTGVIDHTNNTIIPFANRMYDYQYNGFFIVKENGKFGVYDKKGKVIAPNIYEEIIQFRDSFLRVKLNGLYGFIDQTGKEIVPVLNKMIYTYKLSAIYGNYASGEYGGSRRYCGSPLAQVFRRVTCADLNLSVSDRRDNVKSKSNCS